MTKPPLPNLFRSNPVPGNTPPGTSDLPSNPMLVAALRRASTKTAPPANPMLVAALKAQQATRSSAPPPALPPPTASQLAGMAAILRGKTPQQRSEGPLVNVLRQRSVLDELPPINRTPAKSKLPEVRRCTFFSFQFGDSFPVNQVRNSYKIRPENPASAPLWFRDSSIWEEAKLQGDDAIARLILDGLEGTSVTCVLTGEHTWSRPWVRFEIAKSVARGNGLLTVHLHGMNCPNNGVCAAGANPLAFLGVYQATDGKVYLCEKFGTTWSFYSAHREPVSWPKWLTPIQPGYVRALSEGAKAFSYKSQNGYVNLSAWIQQAAVAAGK